MELTPKQEAVLMDSAHWSGRGMEIAEELSADDPTLGITAIIIGQDRAAAERADVLVGLGLPETDALTFIGSYAKVSWALNNLPGIELWAKLPQMWSGSDPDDTDPRFLKMWRNAWEANGRRTLHDGRPLPKSFVQEGRPVTVPVHRGQDKGATIGIAWSLDKAIAEKFAHGAALRQHNRDGEVLTRLAKRSHVFGYMSGRGEEEVIVDPSMLTEMA